MKNSRISDEFIATSNGYIRAIRWHELDKNTLIYVDESLREEFLKRVNADDKVQVVDYRIKNQQCWPKTKTAEMTVEWDYYIPPSVTVKTFKDDQKWRYVEDDTRHVWLLTTLLPELK